MQAEYGPELKVAAPLREAMQGRTPANGGNAALSPGAHAAVRLSVHLAAPLHMPRLPGAQVGIAAAHRSMSAAAGGGGSCLEELRLGAAECAKRAWRLPLLMASVMAVEVANERELVVSVAPGKALQVRGNCRRGTAYICIQQSGQWRTQCGRARLPAFACIRAESRA